MAMGDEEVELEEIDNSTDGTAEAEGGAPTKDAAPGAAPGTAKPAAATKPKEGSK